MDTYFKTFIISQILVSPVVNALISHQEPHPPRMSAESALRRQARLETTPPNIFEQLTKLRPFVEVGSPGHYLNVQLVNLTLYLTYNVACVCLYVCLLQVVSDGLPLVQAVVPKNQNRSFIIQGSDMLV